MRSLGALWAFPIWPMWVQVDRCYQDLIPEMSCRSRRIFWQECFEELRLLDVIDVFKANYLALIRYGT